jgi:hypothetical protein
MCLKLETRNPKFEINPNDQKQKILNEPVSDFGIRISDFVSLNHLNGLNDLNVWNDLNGLISGLV